MQGNATLENNCSKLFSEDSLRERREESRVLLVAVYSLVCVLGLPANGLTAWLTLLQALHGNVLAVYLFCLALCELLYVGTLPLWVVYIQNQHHWTLGPQACKVTGYIFFCNIYVSILLLCCVSCDRFAAVVYALESRSYRHQKVAVVVSASVFLLVGLVHHVVFQMEEGEDTCFETLPIGEDIARYYYLRFAVGFAVPLVTIAFTNHRIIGRVRRSAGLSAAQKAKVKRSAVAVVLIFLACFAPYHLVLFLRAAAFSYYRQDENARCTFESQMYNVSAVFLCLCTLSSVADPVIYVLATDLSRQKVAQIHKEWRAWAAKPDLTKDSQESKSPTLLVNSYEFPRPVCPPSGLGGSPGVPEQPSPM